MAFARSPLKEQSLAFNDFVSGLDALYAALDASDAELLPFIKAETEDTDIEAALDVSNAELMPFIKTETADTDMKATIAPQADQAH
ncbi:hypothetical protein J4E85_009808 [Alternaria conjuncta]|uniref:uncharacterized protein n=1 Tax=Alternaria conjuncta TaxID=181017 RepID=UPI00221F7A6A|nr:uncharacterized protein J4E85_009808 [Alternaria conjuncta]KAI4917716.1 hypothetical protein J4E85_009808 [Alternaria conjuncta]